jgi:uncharacterized membrane protein YhaH (DUF805 family)
MKSVAMKLKPLFMLCLIILCGAVAVYVTRNVDTADSGNLILLVIFAFACIHFFA